HGCPVRGGTGHAPNATSEPRREASGLARTGRRNAHDPPVVVAAVTTMATVRHVQGLGDERESAALVLKKGNEGGAPRANRRGNVQRPSGQRRSISQRKSKNEVLFRRSVVGRRHRRDKKRSRRGVDHRSSGDAQGVDISAR